MVYSLGTPFAMPTFGDPANALVLTATLVEKAEQLVESLTNVAFFEPLTVAFPQLTFPPPPSPLLPTAPNLIDVTWTTPAQPAAFTAPPPDLSNLFPAPFAVPSPTLNFGSLPANTIGTPPTAPAVDLNFTYPTPSVTLPTPPSLFSLNVVEFDPVVIPDFTGTVPALTLVAPTSLNWTEGLSYTSDMLTLLETEMTSALTSDTDIGLDASTQQAMWDAAREREFRAQAAALADLDRMETMGFHLPHGIYLDARLKIQTETAYTTIGLSRDIMVKQAELRLENVTKCRELAVTLEGQLMTYANSVQERLFQNVKLQTESAIQIYNAGVQAYTARIDGFKASIAVYDATIRGIEARIEQLKAQIAFEQTKAQIDATLVGMYKSQIDAALATLEIAKVQVEIIQTQANVEKTKVDIYSAKIQAFLGTVNAYTAQVEGYKAGVEAQGAIEGVYRTQVEAYTAQVQAGASKATALVQGYEAQTKSYEATLDGYKAALQAMVEQARSASEFNQAVTAEYAAEAQALGTYNEVLVKEWQAVTTTTLQIAEVEVKTAEANIQLQISERQLVEEALKGAASIMSQLGAAALGAIHWSSTANWSDSASFSSSLSTSNSTADDHVFNESV